MGTTNTDNYPIDQQYRCAVIACIGEHREVIVAYGHDADALAADIARLPADVRAAIVATYPCDRSMAEYIETYSDAPRKWGLADGVAYVDSGEWLDEVYGDQVRGACRSGSYLRFADLTCADLRGADLRGARGADLTDAAIDDGA